MHKEIVEQTHTFLTNLLEAAEQFQRSASNPILDTGNPEQVPPFDAIEYLVKADQYYHALMTLQDKMRFSSTYLTAIDRERLQYKIDEAVAQFPAICERTLRKHSIDISEAQILEFRVMQPLNKRLQDEAALRGNLDRGTQRIRVLEGELQSSAQRIGTLEGKLQSKTQRIGVLETETETEAELLSNTKLTVDRLTTEHTAQIIQHEAANSKNQNDIRRLSASLQGIRDTLLSHQQNGHYSGCTVTLLGSLSTILGVIIAAIATHFLLIGTGGLLIPAVGLGLGAGMTLFGMSALSTGAQRQREEQLSNTFFPERQ